MKLPLVWLAALCPFFTAQASLLPQNDLYQYDTPALTLGVNEQQFIEISTQITEMYRPAIESHGGRLSLELDWASTDVNAFADRRGELWRIRMYGGLARRPEITPDAFSLVVCHELGHHLGGFPFISDDSWAAVDGQSDYFAAQECLRYLWQNETKENSAARELLSPAEQVVCDGEWTTRNEQDLCQRIMVAAKNVARLLARSSREAPDAVDRLSVLTPDTRIIKRTDQNHPRGQCRLDTYVQAARCPLTFSRDRIPGRLHTQGQNSLAAELESDAVVCSKRNGLPQGARPACWFAER